MARTRTPSGNEDTTTFRCRRCGFPCNLDKDKTGPGSGVSLVYTTTVGNDGTWTGYDPTVVAGCIFCGSKNYKDWQR